MVQIIIVEDDPVIRRELKILLENALYQVEVCECFENVAAQVIAEKPDLVLLDVNLPEKSGFDICIQIREKTDVPIIFLTGRNDSMDEQRDYREYMESWVHEIKAPITSISLLCENGRKPELSEKKEGAYRESFRTISMENQKIENDVDMVLYLARGKEVYKDYLIRETSLQDVVCEVLNKNRLLLMQNQVRAEVDCEDMVYADRKWIVFILNQMVLNSVKYRSENPLFRIFTERTLKGVFLIFEDNGVGIREEEISRIFEKGFTGSNGRSHERSTGMGLYLCQNLCNKMGIGLRAESEYGKGTRIILDFPVSTYVRCE